MYIRLDTMPEWDGLTNGTDRRTDLTKTISRSECIACCRAIKKN